MSGPLDHISGHVLKASRLTGRIVVEKLADRYLLAAYTSAAASLDDLEKTAWTALDRASKATGVEIVESYVARGPDWRLVDPMGRQRVVKANETWCLGVRLSAPLLKQYQAGALSALTLLDMTMEPRRKGPPPMKKMKRVRLEKALAAAVSGAAEPETAMTAFRRTGIAGTSQAMSVALSPFDARVAAAEADLAAAKAADNQYGITAAREALRHARYARTAMKMVAAENARERDAAVASRSFRGQGVPILTNRHALPDDPGVRGI